MYKSPSRNHASHLFLPFYIAPLRYYFLPCYFLKFIFVLAVLALASASSSFRTHHADYPFIRSRPVPRATNHYSRGVHSFPGENDTDTPNNAYYTNTWVSHIKADSYEVQKITQKWVLLQL